MGWSTYYSGEQLSFLLLVWVAQALYVLCFIPQIFENFKLQSERGISDYMLIGNANTYLVLIFDVFCNGYPYPYRLTAFLQFFGSVALIAQSFMYDISRQRARPMLHFYALNLLGALACIPLAISYPGIVGDICAWFLVFLFAVSFVPQIVKIYQAKSVEGFSFAYISIFAVANIIEVVLWMLYDLPLPYFICALQNVLMYVVFCIQFMLYYKKGR